tara:strand:+ start:112117 stop:112464 length:348 start_codon:yes stop_codon:yes gene_type:complete
MINTFKILIISLILWVFQSFTLKSNSNIIGSYGVSTNDPSVIEMVIKEDHTFIYKDFSNPNSRINISGSWELVKGQEVLLTSNFKGKFHNKWKFSTDGNVAKSRRGMTFYTLRKN